MLELLSDINYTSGLDHNTKRDIHAKGWSKCERVRMSRKVREALTDKPRDHDPCLVFGWPNRPKQSFPFRRPLSWQRYTISEINL